MPDPKEKVTPTTEEAPTHPITTESRMEAIESTLALVFLKLNVLESDIAFLLLQSKDTGGLDEIDRQRLSRVTEDYSEVMKDREKERKQKSESESTLEDN